MHQIKHNSNIINNIIYKYEANIYIIKDKYKYFVYKIYICL